MEHASNFDIEHRETAELELVAEAEEFDPGPLGALTLEQGEVFEMYSQGKSLDEIARQKGTDKSNIHEVIRSVQSLFEADKATVTMAMLKEGALSVSAGEAETADEASIRLAPALKEVLGAFVIAGTYEDAAEMLDHSTEETRLLVEDAAAEMNGYNMAQIARLAYAARLDEYYQRRHQLIEELNDISQTEYQLDPELSDQDMDEPEQDLKAETTEEPRTEEYELPTDTKANILTYMRWMYPRQENLDEILDALTDLELYRLSDAVRTATQKYISNLKPLRIRRAVKPAGEYADRWLVGMNIPAIAAALGKNDGTVALSLQPFAEKVGKSIILDELIANSEEVRDK